MADLLHEYWENEDGAEFSIVRERNDLIRPTVCPDARLVFSFRAASWNEAMQVQYDRLDLGTYDALGMEDIVYTDADATEQAEYLSRRKGS